MTTLAYQLTDINVSIEHQCILNIPELSLAQGECIALLGDNGAGKSTLLSLLAFTQRANQGKIQLAGQEITLSLSSKQRRSIGVVTQHPLLLRGTITDNIMLALKLQGITAKEHALLTQNALKQVNLSHLAHQSTASLSGGELKRAAIARAIAYKPDVLLLDEPFSHLDQHSSQQLENIIQQLNSQAGTTIIFSTHNRLQGLALADNTINLVNGRVVPSPLINLFHGTLHNHIFNTGNLQIHTTSNNSSVQNIAINPNEIIISHQPLQSSMRNSFKGRLILIAEEADTVRLMIDCGEKFHVLISVEALAQLSLSLGSLVYLSFKSTATTLF